jgi:hypothetical protein
MAFKKVHCFCREMRKLIGGNKNSKEGLVGKFYLVCKKYRRFILRIQAWYVGCRACRTARYRVLCILWERMREARKTDIVRELTRRFQVVKHNCKGVEAANAPADPLQQKLDIRRRSFHSLDEKVQEIKTRTEVESQRERMIFGLAR